MKNIKGQPIIALRSGVEIHRDTNEQRVIGAAEMVRRDTDEPDIEIFVRIGVVTKDTKFESFPEEDGHNT